MNKYYQTPQKTFVFKIYPYMNILWNAVIYSWNSGKLEVLNTLGAWDTSEQVINKIATDFGRIEEISKDEYFKLCNVNKEY